MTVWTVGMGCLALRHVNNLMRRLSLGFMGICCVNAGAN